MVTTSTGIHKIQIFAYASEHICLPHHICRSHCTNNIVYMETPKNCTFKSHKIMNCNFIIYVPATNMPLKCHIWQQPICLPHCTCVPLNYYCSLHTDLTFLHTSIKNQYIATHINQTTMKYVPGTNMPIKCHKAKLLDVHQCWKYANMYAI